MSCFRSYEINETESEKIIRLQTECCLRELRMACVEAEKLQGEHGVLLQAYKNVDFQSMNQNVKMLQDQIRKQQQSLHNQKQLIQNQQIKLGENLKQLSQLDVSLSNEIEKIAKQYIPQIQKIITNIEQLQSLSINHLSDLARAENITQEYSIKLLEIQKKHSQLNAELEFIRHNDKTSLGAIALLFGMGTSGYTLNSDLAGSDLTFYFQKAENNHQIAVQILPIENKSNHWELLCETFNMDGSTCLAELEDFEESMEVLDLVQLSRGKIQVYPKDNFSDSSKKLEKIITPLNKNIKIH